VEIGLHGVRVVQGAGAHEQCPRHRVISAPDRRAAIRAEKHIVRLTAAGFGPERGRLFSGRFDMPALDPDVRREGGAGEPLAIAAMTGMHDQRRVGQLVTSSAAGAPAFHHHRLSPCLAPQSAAHPIGTDKLF